MPQRRKSAAITMVRAAVLTQFVPLVKEAGGDAVALLRKAGISQSWLHLPDQQIPSDQVVDLLEEAARVTGCAALALRMAAARQVSNLGPISLLISHQETLRDVLYTIGQYRHILNEALVLDVQTQGRTALLREEVLTRVPRPSRQATELAVGVLFMLCQFVLGRAWRPLQVSFTHAAPPDLQEHRRFFQCKLVFDADFNGIVCAAADLDSPNPLADPAMARYAQRYVESLEPGPVDDVGQQVRKAIYLLLPVGRATIVQIAGSLGLNARTLQRRLADAGTSFGGLLDTVRAELAPRYMSNPAYSLGRVAELLGYAKQSSFNRWFVVRFGCAPGTWRARHA